MKKDKEMKKMMEQIETLNKRIDCMAKEMYEIRKGNTLGAY